MELRDIPYKVSYRQVKYPRLEFKTGELLIVLPFGVNPEVLLDKYRDWIIKQVNFIKECLENTKNNRLSRRTEEEFRKLIYDFTVKLSRDLKVEVNHIYFRKMKTKWASLSSARNLTANRLMKYLPEYLIEYVIYHELTHIIEKRHNERFWKIISQKYENYQEMEREMFIYWFLVFKKEDNMNMSL